MNFNRITNRWQPYPPPFSCVYMCTQPVCLSCLRMLMYVAEAGKDRCWWWTGKTETISWSVGPGDLLTVSLAVLVLSLRIESSCSLVPLQPASLRSAPHTQTTGGNYVVTRPELRPANAFDVRGGNYQSWSAVSTIPFCCEILRQQQLLQIHPYDASELNSGTAHHKVWGGVIDFCLALLSLVVSSPWKLEQWSIEIW